MNRLAPDHQRFVDEYLVDRNATQAAIRAGYSGGYGSDLLRRADVSAAVDEALAWQARRTGVSAERVLREYARIAFADPRAACAWDGETLRPLDSGDLDPDTAAAVSEIRRTRDSVTVKMYDKKAALDAIARYLGLFEAGGAARAADDDGGVVVYLPDNGRAGGAPAGDS